MATSSGPARTPVRRRWPGRRRAAGRPGPPTVVVQAHPLEDSYNASLRAAVLGALAPCGPTCYRLDQGEEPPAGVLAGAERLVLVYPTWSGGLPTALLQWGHGVLDEPGLLAEVREVVAVTTHGSSQLINRLQGEWGRRWLRTRLLAACHPDATFRWVALYKVDRRSRAEMARHLGRVARALAPSR